MPLSVLFTPVNLLVASFGRVAEKAVNREDSWRENKVSWL